MYRLASFDSLQLGKWESKKNGYENTGAYSTTGGPKFIVYEPQREEKNISSARMIPNVAPKFLFLLCTIQEIRNQ